MIFRKQTIVVFALFSALGLSLLATPSPADLEGMSGSPRPSSSGN